ncbi:Zinc finger FYVE domain-containing protein 26 [Trifolium repens]|nr:Zinc finger FYVE domain-containing protein 26 [Trifolium repens]
MRDNTLPILSFHLKCVYRFYSNKDFYNVLYAAITQQVQNLIIDSSIMTAALPTFILTTKTLSVLKLKGVTVTLNKDYSDIDLPSLRVLHLES